MTMFLLTRFLFLTIILTRCDNEVVVQQGRDATTPAGNNLKSKWSMNLKEEADAVHLVMHLPKINGNEQFMNYFMNQTMKNELWCRITHKFMNVSNTEIKHKQYDALEKTLGWIALVLAVLIIIRQIFNGLLYQPQTEIFIEIKNRNESVILHWGFLPHHPSNYHIRKLRLPVGNIEVRGLRMTLNMRIRFVESETSFESLPDAAHYVGIWNARKIQRIIVKNYHVGIIMMNPAKTFSRIDRMQIVNNLYRVKLARSNIPNYGQTPETDNTVLYAQRVPAATNLRAARAFAASSYFHLRRVTQLVWGEAAVLEITKKGLFQMILCRLFFSFGFVHNFFYCWLHYQ